MTYRKTWFSYVLWAVYAGICVMLLAFMGFYLYSKYISASMAKIGGLLIFPVAVGAYWAIRAVAQIVRKKTLHEHTAQMLEVFVAALSIVFGILYRMYYVLCSEAYFDTAAVAQTAIKDILEVPYATYYDMALVRAGEQLTPLTHSAGYLYVLCVSAVCSFLGNKIVSAVLFQAVIQIVSIVLGYLIVRKAAGKLPACIVLVYLSFSDTYIGEVYRIDPDCFVFMLYLIGLLLIMKYIKDYCDNKFRKPMAVCVAVFVGIAIGILVYLDLKLIVLLIFMIGLFTGRKKCTDGERINNTIKNSILSFIVTIVSCVAGFFIMFGIVALYRGTAFGQDLSAWLELYLQQSHVTFFNNVMQELPVVALFSVAASFLVFEFLRNSKDQNYMLWILACILIAPTPMTGCGILPYTMIALFQWSVLAGLGLQNCIFGGQAKVVQAMIEEINASVEPIAEKTHTEENPVQTVEKPRFIENPLPLPKKHVKKEMDYQYPVADKDMKYDIEVDENDDFDIQ